MAITKAENVLESKLAEKQSIYAYFLNLQKNSMVVSDLNDERVLICVIQRESNGEYQLLDILFIAGVKGQVAVAQKALSKLVIKNVMIVRISKGVDRKVGMEKRIIVGQQ
jgi:excinuclease UvrABC nuclease subunit